MNFIARNPKAEIVALADIYEPSLQSALNIAPKAKTYRDYRALLADKNVEAVVVATPLNTHYQIVMDAFDAGKHVYCEKSIGYTMEECFKMYQKHLETGKIFFSGQQRLFDPRYIQVMDLVHRGTFGKVSHVEAYWNRNGDWRRNVPSPELERLINWRLYKESSKGLMTELGCHPDSGRHMGNAETSRPRNGSRRHHLGRTAAKCTTTFTASMPSIPAKLSTTVR